MSDSILAGAVAGLRMLVDGTVAVTLHFEPKDRAATMTLLGVPGAMVGVARLADGSGAAGKSPDPRGPLCMEAIGLCNNRDFQVYVSQAVPGNVRYDPTPEGAKAYLLKTCGIESRKEIDADPIATAVFVRIQEVFRKWMLNRDNGKPSKPQARGGY